MSNERKKLVDISRPGDHKHSNNVQPTKYEKPTERPKPSPPPPPKKKSE